VQEIVKLKAGKGYSVSVTRRFRAAVTTFGTELHFGLAEFWLANCPA